jgi:peroxiredoxin
MDADYREKLDASKRIDIMSPLRTPNPAWRILVPTFLKSFTLLTFAMAAALASGAEPIQKSETPATKTLAVGDQAPEFKIKDAKGQEINLAELTAKGPVLVRLTCGCTGCDRELAYFQELHKAYQGQGLTSVAIFRESDEKVAKYVEEKKLNMLYAVDPKGTSWQVFQTKSMPTNLLIDKGGKIVSVATGCDPSGLLAAKLGDKVAGLVHQDKVDIQAKAAGKSVPDKLAK